METTYIIAGLGNPGNKYDNTRHNVGFDAVDLLAHLNDISISKVKFKALIGEGNIEGKRVILVKPQTFMNLSGESIREVLEWYKIPVGNIIIMFDDIDLELGKIRIRPKGSSGTHNGMRNILYQIQSDEFPRVRIGIGRPPEGWNLADYVLSKFIPGERSTINDSIKNTAEAVSTILKAGVDAAMNKFNK
jgi:PTH1 family peptidyl-tRNA hydrolase